MKMAFGRALATLLFCLLLSTACFAQNALMRLSPDNAMTRHLIERGDLEPAWRMGEDLFRHFAQTSLGSPDYWVSLVNLAEIERQLIIAGPAAERLFLEFDPLLPFVTDRLDIMAAQHAFGMSLVVPAPEKAKRWLHDIERMRLSNPATPPDALMETFVGLGELYWASGQYAGAPDYFIKALDLARRHQLPNTWFVRHLACH